MKFPIKVTVLIEHNCECNAQLQRSQEARSELYTRSMFNLYAVESAHDYLRKMGLMGRFRLWESSRRQMDERR